MSLQTIFLSAKKKLIQDLQSPLLTERLSAVTTQIVATKTLAHHLNADTYRCANIPAYYDPNRCTVYLNSSAMRQLDESTIFIICYHELIHGASSHNNYQDATMNVFQSGIKIERYDRNKYSCVNRLLNEGLVQFFTTYNNQVDHRQYAYTNEVSLITLLVQDLGLQAIHSALFHGDYEVFSQTFEAHYGNNTFESFTQSIDKKNYEKARKIITERAAPSLQTLFFRPNALAATVNA